MRPEDSARTEFRACNDTVFVGNGEWLRCLFDWIAPVSRDWRWKLTPVQSRGSSRVPYLSIVVLHVIANFAQRRSISASLRNQSVARQIWAISHFLGVEHLNRQAGDAVIWNLTGDNCLETMIFAESSNMPPNNRVARCSMERTGKEFTKVSQTALFRRLKPDTKRRIVDYAAKRINVLNCVTILECARAYGLEIVACKAFAYITRNFVKVSVTPVFVFLSKDSLNTILNERSLNTGKDRVIEGILHWTQRGVAGCESDTADLLRNADWNWKALFRALTHCMEFQNV